MLSGASVGPASLECRRRSLGFSWLYGGIGGAGLVCRCLGIVGPGMEMHGGLAVIEGGGLGGCLSGDGYGALAGRNLCRGGGLGTVFPVWRGVFGLCCSQPLFLGPLVGAEPEACSGLLGGGRALWFS